MAPLTLLGYWFVDAVTRVPVGDPFNRPARIAMLFAVLAIALVGWTLLRRGHPAHVSAALALAFAFAPFLFTRLTTSPPAAAAALLICIAMAGLLAHHVTRRRVTVAAVLAALAIGVDPSGATIALLALVVALAVASLVRVLPVGATARAFLIATLVIVLMLDRLTTSSDESWRLSAWRDAVETTIPGAVIATRAREAAALDGRLFRGRPAAVRLAHVDDDAALPEFVLEDLHPVAATGSQLERVPIALTTPEEWLSHVPHGTIAGVAVTRALVSRDPSSVAGLLRHLGISQSAPDGFATFAVLGMPRARGELRHSSELLLGDTVPGTAVRAPADIRVTTDEHGVSAQFRGRDLVAGASWAVILLDPHGRLLDTLAGPGPTMRFPVELEGLRVWRRRAPRHP